MHQSALRNFVQRHRRGLGYFAIGLALVVWWALDVQRRGRVDPLHPTVHKTDFTCFTEAGAAFFDGRDPYLVTNPRGWGYCYPPLFALLVSPLYDLDPRAQVTVWFAISLLFTWGCYRECVRVVRGVCGVREGESLTPAAFPRWIGGAALLTAALPVLNCLQRGQVEVLKLYLLLLGFRLCIAAPRLRNWFAGGVALSLAVVLKMTPLLPVGFLLCLLATRWLVERRPRDAGRAAGLSLGAACGAVAAVLLLPAAILGWQANLDHLGRLSESKIAKVNDYQHADRTGNTLTVRNQSLSNAVIRLGDFLSYQFFGGLDDRLIDRAPLNHPPFAMDDPGVARVLLASRLALVALLGAAGLATALRRDGLGQAACFGLACTAALVVSPISRGFYFAELVPGVLLVPLWLRKAGLPGAARWMAFAPPALVLTHYLLLPIAGRLGVLGLGTTVWYATGLGLLLVRARRPLSSAWQIPPPKGRRHFETTRAAQAGGPPAGVSP